MTDHEVATAVAEIRGLIAPSTPNEGRLEADRRHARRAAVQRAVAREYGRRRGWTLARTCFDCHRLTEQPRTGRDGGLNWMYPRIFDHNFGFLLHRKPAAVVTHPYDVDEQTRANMRAWAVRHGLVVSFPDFPSWWYPGWTTIVEFARPEALPAVSAALVVT